MNPKGIDIGDPEQNPGIIVEPIQDPVPREEPVPPQKSPKREKPRREPVPA